MNSAEKVANSASSLCIPGILRQEQALHVGPSSLFSLYLEKTGMGLHRLWPVSAGPDHSGVVSLDPWNC